MGYHGENAGPVPPPASDPDELWRQAAKARIRERILREEAELEVLEAQVRRELMEERTPLLLSGLGRSAGSGAALGSAPTPAPSGTQTRIELKALSKANASVTLPMKRKNTDVTLASAASISTSTNKKELSCTLCDIPATSEKALQDHLKGKAHMKKAAKLAQPMAETWHEDDDEAMQVHSKENVLAVLPDKQKDPNIVTVTSKTQKPDLTCKVCGITSTSQKAMQDHLEGKAHKRKVSKLPQPMPALELPSKENVPKDASILSAAESDKKHNLNLSCTLCGIPLTSEKAMEDHLKGKSHRKKATALVREATEHVQEEKEEKCSFTPTKKTMMTKDGMIHDVMQIDEKEEEASFTPTKKTMMTKDGTIHDVMQMNGYVFCEVCNVRTADIVTMMCHLQGIKHISKARQEATKPPAETVTIATSVANGDPQMVAEVITKDVALATNFHITETPGQEEMMDDGADSIGGSELVEAKSKEASLVPGEPAVGACVPESMAPYGGATVGCPTAKVEENEADAEGNSSGMQEMEAVKTNGIVVVPADQDEVKYQVEGKEFIVLRQPDGRLSCRLCDVHGCEKYDMVKHLYTHLGNAHLAD
nr:uncharacterized protein LOC127299478 [Lolium perenne]